MALTINDKISVINYKDGKNSLVRPLVCASGSLVQNGTVLEASIDVNHSNFVDVDSVVNYGITLQLSVLSDITLVSGTNYTLSVKGVGSNTFQNVGALSLTPRFFEYSSHEKIMKGDIVTVHKKYPSGGYTLIKNTTALTYLSNVSHSSNFGYLVVGSGYSGTPSKFLREDGSWVAVSGGSSYPTLSSSAHASGTSYVVNGSGNNTNSFLRGDGVWATPQGTTYNTFTATSNGLVPAPTSTYANQRHFLSGNGSWVSITDCLELATPYFSSGNPTMGAVIPLTECTVSTSTYSNLDYDHDTLPGAIFYPRKKADMGKCCLAVEMSKDGVLYVPISGKLGSVLGHDYEFDSGKLYPK